MRLPPRKAQPALVCSTDPDTPRATISRGLASFSPPTAGVAWNTESATIASFVTRGARFGGAMPYQYVREPLTAEEADRLANACETPTEQLIVWTLLDTGLRVSELCDLTSKDVLWQQRQLRVKGKGGPYGKKTKVRVVPMSRRVRALLEHHFALEKASPSGNGEPRTSSRRSPTGRGSPRT